MTQKRRLPEQMALHTYKRQVQDDITEQGYQTRRGELRHEVSRRMSGGERRRLQRVVTIPEADPSTAWNTFAQRQEQRRRERARAQSYRRMEPRTYAQTGTWSTGERSKVVRRLPSYRGSPIPPRSRRRMQPRGFLWRALAFFMGAVAVVVAANFAVTTNALRIEQVNVEGTHNDALIRSIQHMGLRGQNIFLINTTALTARIEALPLVLSATISRQWPNQITVSVVERRTELTLRTASGAYSVDRQGVVIAPINTMAVSDSARIIYMDELGQSKGSAKAASLSQPLRAGMRLNQDDIAFALTIFNLFPKVTGIQAFKLHYDGTIYANSTAGAGLTGNKGSYSVESPDGWVAYLGSAQDANPLENRLMELQQILALAQKRQLKLATIDLRYGLHPVYTVKS
jgi:POTRA domain, FtsQ-type